MMVHVVLSEDGQKEAIRQWIDGACKQKLFGEVDITYLDKPYTSILSDGSVVIGDEKGYSGKEVCTSWDKTTCLSSKTYKMDTLPFSAQEAAEWWEAQYTANQERLADQSRYDAEQLQLRQDAMRAKIEADGPSAGVTSKYNSRVVHDDVPEDLVESVKDSIRRYHEDLCAREAERERVREEAEVKRISEKQDRDEYVLNSVKTLGSPSQKERLEAGMLPISEAYDVCREHVFSAYQNLDIYKRMTVAEVHDNCDCHGDVEFSTEDCETATDDQWEQMKVIRSLNKKAMKAEVTLRRHIAECDDEVQMERYGILVEIDSGPVCFSREFAVHNFSSGE